MSILIPWFFDWTILFSFYFNHFSHWFGQSLHFTYLKYIVVEVWFLIHFKRWGTSRRGKTSDPDVGWAIKFFLQFVSEFRWIQIHEFHIQIIQHIPHCIVGLGAITYWTKNTSVYFLEQNHCSEVEFWKFLPRRTSRFFSAGTQISLG